MSSSGSNLENYLIPLEEINRATENFSKEWCIGGGGFGAVYKGQLSERWQNRTAAIKRLDPDSYQGEREFRNEIEMISKFHHENIISFIGYCDEDKEMIIVYEYAINGSLDHHLGDLDKMRHISWTQRLKICIGAARGLNYLHSGLGEHNRVIHRDVKSANILLDGNLVAKVCDFGLSKVGPRNQHDTQLYTKVAGTQYYLDPTYNESSILRKESDVYSFGVVLFEILSGMLVYRIRSIDNEKQFLMHSIRRYHQKETDKIIDLHLIDQISCRSFDVFKEIAYQCISYNLMERPVMETVINKIEEALTIQTSVDSMCTLAERSEIQSLVSKLNSASPYDQQIAASLIVRFSQISDDHRAVISQAGAIPLFTGLLTALDSQTQTSAVMALHFLMFWQDNIRVIESSGAVPGIVHLLRTGSLDVRENAAAILAKLCEIDEYKVTIDAAVAIPPLVLLLSESYYLGKTWAATALFHLCKDQGNTRTAVRAGVVPILIEFHTKEGFSVNSESSVLTVLSSHPEGKLAIRKQAVPILVEVLGSGSLDNKENATAVLLELCSIDQMYLVEAQKHGVVMGSLMDLLQNGTDWGKEIAKQLLEKIEDHRQGRPVCVIC